MIEQTLVIIKPDAMMKGGSIVHQIKQRYVDAGLCVIQEFRFRMSESDVREFYQEHKGRFYFEGLVLAMSCGLCTVLILEGKEASKVVRNLNGATDPAKAEPGTIRHDFRSAGGPFNTVHGSDSITAFLHELQVIYKYNG